MFKIVACLSPACLLAAASAVAQDAPVQPASMLALDAAVPQVPAGFAASYAAPARDANGAYRTPNRDLSPAEVTWHLRVALNVAALGCRDQATGYNAMLTAEKAPLAAADAGAQAAERARWGGESEARHDDAMTKLYNYFAQPPAQAGFCAAADEVLRAAATVKPDDFPAFAEASLPKLEAPFLAAFARFDGYRADLAGWQARHAPVAALTVQVASTPVTPPVAAAPLPAVLIASAEMPTLTPAR